MNLDHKIPPPAVFLISGALMWLLAMGNNRHTGAISVLLIAASWLIGTVFSIAGIRTFRAAKTTVNPMKPDTASTLVTAGVFQITRNPMYLGLVFLLFAWAIYLGAWLPFLLIVAFIFYIHQFQILPEERAMRMLFGDAYENYTKQVRRWI